MKPVDLPVCLICTGKNLSIEQKHFYSYRKCHSCGHSVLRSSEQGCSSSAKKKFISDIRRNGDMVQGTLTQSFYDRTGIANQKTLSMFLPYLQPGQKILDANARSGCIVKSLREKGFLANGLASDDSLQSYWGPHIVKSKLSVLSTKDQYDSILMLEYLEYSYCLTSELLDAYARLKPAGKVLVIIPIGNDPIKNFQGRTHEFSAESAKILAKEADLNSEVVEMNDVALLVLQRGL